jgi:hypothetical protein
VLHRPATILRILELSLAAVELIRRRRCVLYQCKQVVYQQRICPPQNADELCTITTSGDTIQPQEQRRVVIETEK